MKAQKASPKEETDVFDVSPVMVVVLYKGRSHSLELNQTLQTKMP